MSEATAPHTADLQELLHVLTAVRNGDFTHLAAEGAPGVVGELAQTLNELIRQLNAFASETTRLSQELGRDGIFGGQAEVPGAAGTWRDLVDNFNYMSANLTDQVRNFAQVSQSYATGDFTPRATVPCDGETLQLLHSLNRIGETMAAG